MKPRDEVQDLRETLNRLRDLELTIAELYRNCAEASGTDQDFWRAMERAEERHALNIVRLLDFLAQKPQGLTFGRRFQTAAIQTAIGGVRQNIRKIQDRGIRREKLLYLSRDLEQSLLERQFYEAIECRDPQCLGMIQEIIADTLAHREMLEQTIRRLAS